jgi:hypothetical protein
MLLVMSLVMAWCEDVATESLPLRIYSSDPLILETLSGWRLQGMLWKMEASVSRARHPL